MHDRNTIKLHVQVFLMMNMWMSKHVEGIIIKLKHYCKKCAFCWFFLHIKHCILYTTSVHQISVSLLLRLPLALQSTVVFGLSNNNLPFFPIYHQFSPSSHSQHLKISFYSLFLSFPGSSTSSRPLQFLGEIFFWASCPPPFSPGDLASLSFALLSILLYFLPCSSLLVLHSSYFPILRFHI